MSNKKIGGQAVLEGVMLRNGETGGVATANRLENGKINITRNSFTALASKNKFFGMPIIRGVVSFVESLVVGTKTLMDSAEIVGGDAAEEYKPSKFELFLSEKLKIKVDDIIIFISLILGVGLALFLFTFIPTFVTGLFKPLLKSGIILSIIEGIIKALIFLAYIVLVSKQKDIKRVFQYHGAEHKTINCFEADMDVTVENVRKSSRIHPRCGTSFIFYVMLVSILVSSFIPWGHMALRYVLKILLLPVVAGISYEIIRFSGNTDNKIIKCLTKPGMALQKITTAEPDDKQIEVGIASLKGLLDKNYDPNPEEPPVIDDENASEEVSAEQTDLESENQNECETTDNT